ncbi:universal stress protein [Chloroflexota bacterium]
MYKRIPVPLDGPELAGIALHYAEELASRLKTEVALLQVVLRAYHLYDGYKAVSQAPDTNEDRR